MLAIVLIAWFWVFCLSNKTFPDVSWSADGSKTEKKMKMWWRKAFSLILWRRRKKCDTDQFTGPRRYYHSRKLTRQELLPNCEEKIPSKLHVYGDRNRFCMPRFFYRSFLTLHSVSLIFRTFSLLMLHHIYLRYTLLIEYYWFEKPQFEITNDNKDMPLNPTAWIFHYSAKTIA